jgi:hypothetical protein
MPDLTLRPAFSVRGADLKELSMWQVVGGIASGLTLVAFIVAAITTVVQKRLKTRERQLLSAPAKDRAALIESLNDTFLVPSLPIDTATLTDVQRYNLLLEQIRGRSNRFYVTSIIVIVIALATASITVYAISKTSGSAAVPTVGEEKRTMVNEIERVYVFHGPFRIARSGDNVMFNLTEVIAEQQVKSSTITIEAVAFTGHVINESDEAFGYDQEILIFSEPSTVLSRVHDSTDYGNWQNLENSYSRARRMLQITSRTDSDRVIHSTSPIAWSVSVADGIPSSGELKFLKQKPLIVGDQGKMFVQVFLWTLWGGDHFVELSDIELKITMRLTSPT